MEKAYYHIADGGKVYVTVTAKKSWNKDPVIESVTIGRPEEVVELLRRMGFNLLEDPDFKKLLVSKGYCC